MARACFKLISDDSRAKIEFHGTRVKTQNTSNSSHSCSFLTWNKFISLKQYFRFALLMWPEYENDRIGGFFLLPLLCTLSKKGGQEQKTRDYGLCEINNSLINICFAIMLYSNSLWVTFEYVVDTERAFFPIRKGFHLLWGRS